MKKRGLTPKQVEHMKADPEKRVNVPAGPPAGLYLTVHPGGRKSWIVRYRFRGRTRGLTFTEGYPDMTLARARAEAEACLAKLGDGIDPAITQAGEIEAATPDTVGTVAEEWLTRHVRKNTKPKSAVEIEGILNRDILPNWKHRLVTEIGRADVLRLVDAVVDRGAPIAANRTYEAVRALYNWAIGRGIVDTSPVAGLRPPSIERSRERVLTGDEMAEVWNVAGALPYPCGPWLRVLILTAQRRGEVAAMRWADIDLERALWTLPAEATKAGRSHDVPLAPAVLAMLGDVPRFESDDEDEEKRGVYAWTTTAGILPINGWSKMKRKTDDAILAARRKADPKAAPMDAWRLHDLRRTAATNMARAGVAPHVLSAILNHAPGSTQGVTHIYNRFRYTEARRAALGQWALYVASLGEKARKEGVA